MPFPTDGSWPPPRCPGVRSLRIYVADTVVSGSVFADNTNHWLFHALDPGYTDTGDIEAAGGKFGSYLKPGPPFGGNRAPSPGTTLRTTNATITDRTQDPPPPPFIHSQYIRITNLNTTTGEDLEFSFDGVNVHGYVPAGESRVYDDRREAGIAIRPVAAADTDFILEVW